MKQQNLQTPVKESKIDRDSKQQDLEKYSSLLPSSISSCSDKGKQVVIKPLGIVEAGSDGEEDEDKTVTCKSHGMMSVIGWWRVMEDAVTMVPSVAIGESGRYDFFAVYDGHGGARVANACSDKMHQLVAKEVAKGERIGRGKGLEY